MTTAHTLEARLNEVETALFEERAKRHVQEDLLVRRIVALEATLGTLIERSASSLGIKGASELLTAIAPK